MTQAQQLVKINLTHVAFIIIGSVILLALANLLITAITLITKCRRKSVRIDDIKTEEENKIDEEGGPMEESKGEHCDLSRESARVQT